MDEAGNGRRGEDSDAVTAGPVPLSAADLRRALVRPRGLWREIAVVGQTGSTNTDLIKAARAGAAEGVVLAAETQTAGRGRMGRSWVSRPGAALTFSVLLRPAGVAPSAVGWVPLLGGVAAAAALRRAAAVHAVLKWPNDVLVGHRKLVGILAEQAGDAIALGIGINVSAPPGAVAVHATSLAQEGAGRVGRDELLVAVLRELEERYLRWRADPHGPGLRELYESMCDTVGRAVHVELPGGRLLAGTAVAVDRYGRLVVDAGGTATPVSAGDVVHVR